jgi:hypothetical protein
MELKLKLLGQKPIEHPELSIKIKILEKKLILFPAMSG